MGKTYGRPPSSWLPELGPAAAYLFDVEALKAGGEAEQREIDRQKRISEARSKLRHGR